jgi:hypothetical protein
MRSNCTGRQKGDSNLATEEYKEWLVYGEENEPDDDDDGLGDAEPDEPSEDEPEGSRRFT